MKDYKMVIKSDNPWEPVEIFVNGDKVQPNTPIILLRGQENEVRLERVTPAIAKSVSLGLVNDSGLTIEADPQLETWVEVTSGSVTWALTPENGKSGRINSVVMRREVDEFLDLACLVISANLADEVKEVVVADYSSPSAHDIFFRNEPRTVTVTYQPGSPLPAYPLELTGTVLTGASNLTVTSTGVNAWSVKPATTAAPSGWRCNTRALPMAWRPTSR
jgi:hypothetical protein